MPKTKQRQHGSIVISIAIGLALASFLAVLAAGEISRRINDAAAESTGRYMMSVRSALIKLQVKHEAWLQGVDITNAPPGTYPAAPSITWQPGPGVQIARLEVTDLRSDGVLPGDFPLYPSLGERVQAVLVREGTCPGEDCQIQAFAYTCFPVSKQRSQRQLSNCASPTAAYQKHNPSLLGQVMLSSEGYGGHDVLSDGSRFNGPLINAPRSWFGISSHPGHAVITASLDATPFAQFVRQGDTRHIMLRNQLTVDGAIQTNTGLVFGHTVVLGQACSPAGMFAATSDNQLAVCKSGIWNSSTGQSVQTVHTNLIHNAFVAPPTCSATSTPFRYVALSATDVTVTGGALDVHGNIGGTVSGSGTVNAAGAITLSGTFGGEFAASPSSSVRVSQAASLSAANRIVITPAGANARASVIQGCTS